MKNREIKYNMHRTIKNTVPAIMINLNGRNYQEPTADILVERIKRELKNDYNPSGLFMHPKTSQYTHLVFIGNAMDYQDSIIEILQLLQKTNQPKHVTIETNGSKALSDDLKRFFIGRTKEWSDGIKESLDLTWEITVDSFTVFSNITDYQSMGTNGIIKFNLETSWNDIEFKVKVLRETHNINWDVHIESSLSSANIKEEVFNRGYNLSIVEN